jgi:hypothetical protein
MAGVREASAANLQVCRVFVLLGDPDARVFSVFGLALLPEPAIARHWGAEYTCYLMMLTPDRPLEAQLWQSVVQSRAEAQPVFRT